MEVSHAIGLLFQLVWGVVDLLTIGLAVALVRTRSIAAMVLMIASACLHLFASALSFGFTIVGHDVQMVMLISTLQRAITLFAGVSIVASSIVLATAKTEQRM